MSVASTHPQSTKCSDLKLILHTHPTYIMLEARLHCIAGPTMMIQNKTSSQSSVEAIAETNYSVNQAGRCYCILKSDVKGLMWTYFCSQHTKE